MEPQICQSEEEFEAAMADYPPCPVKPEPKPEGVVGGFEIPIDSACPVCGVVAQQLYEGQGETTVPSGCYVAYSGRRLDCFSFWGRVLSEEEGQQLADWAEGMPVPPPVTLPSSSVE